MEGEGGGGCWLPLPTGTESQPGPGEAASFSAPPVPLPDAWPPRMTDLFLFCVGVTELNVTHLSALLSSMLPSVLPRLLVNLTGDGGICCSVPLGLQVEFKRKKVAL